MKTTGPTRTGGIEARSVDMVVLPNVEGLVEHEIEAALKRLGLHVAFVEDDAIVSPISNAFAGYVGHDIGAHVPAGRLVRVRLSQNRSPYFRYKHVRYEGPKLTPEAFSRPWRRETEDGPYGTAGAFEVLYRPADGRGFSIDGDTTVFWYPEDIFRAIPSPVKSVRYFLIDAPETYPGGEEKWGLTATDYIEMCLTEAETIAVQTDKNDRLFDAYGRLLAWVWVRFPGHADYQLLNEMLLRQGLARIAYTFGAGEGYKMVCRGRTYHEWLIKAENKATAERLGMHGDKSDIYWDDATNAPGDRWLRST